MIPAIFFVGIVLGAFGSILMKMGANSLGPVEISSIEQLFHFLVRLFTNAASLAGITLYFLSAVTWSYLLTKLDVSYVQPILALTYVATPLLAIILLNESIPAMRWIGIAIIILGVYVVARSAAI